MVKRLAAWAALFVAITVSVGPVQARGLDDAASFEIFADSLMSAGLARHHIPGGVLVAVAGGRVVFSRGYGYADVERKTRVDPDRTIFRVASISKVFTATAAMQLVEQGRMALTEDVNRYLKRFHVPATYPEPVTLFHLLTHTAGFDDRNIGRKSPTEAGVEPLGAYLARRLPPRIFPPGRLLCYSNHGMALAGELVEEVSGVPFDRYMRENVFEPLGMSRSTFAIQTAASSDLAVGYDDSDPPQRVPVEYVQTRPASMLTTTGMDVAKFMIAHLGNGRLGASRILGERTAGEMHRRQFAQHPLLPGIGLGFWERFQNGERGLWHDGDLAGFTSLLYLLPEQGTGFFMAFNGRAGNAARGEVLAGLLDRYFPDPRPSVAPERFAGWARAVQRCAGTYVFNRYGHRSLEKIASLFNQVEIRPDSGGTLAFRGDRYVAIAPLLFRRSDGRNYLAFRADARGRVTHMFTGDPMARAYERVPWYATSRMQLAVVGSSCAIFLWSLLAGLWARARRRAPARAARSSFESWAKRAPTVAALLNLLFLSGFAAYLILLPSELEYGLSPLFVTLLTMPLLSAAVAATMALHCARLWGASRGSSASRIGYALATVTSVGFVAWLAQWNLLGYRF